MAWYFRDAEISPFRGRNAIDGVICPDCGGDDISTSTNGDAFACNAGDADDHCGCQWERRDITVD